MMTQKQAPGCKHECPTTNNCDPGIMLAWSKSSGASSAAAAAAAAAAAVPHLVQIIRDAHQLPQLRHVAHDSLYTS
jgi:hypothetical protein